MFFYLCPPKIERGLVGVGCVVDVRYRVMGVLNEEMWKSTGIPMLTSPIYFYVVPMSGEVLSIRMKNANIIFTGNIIIYRGRLGMVPTP